MSSLAIAGGKPLRTKPFARWPEFGATERTALIEVLESGIWGGYSPAVDEFERAFAVFHHASHGVCASNGTVTLEGALLAAGVGPGDEVIVPPITFAATATAVLRAGATPVFADVEAHYNLDPERVCEALSPRTKAVIPVHFGGHPADMDAILALAREHGLTVIEDAAHAHGASWKGNSVGTLGDIASFSFQQSKSLTAGEGGILIGNNAELVGRARSFFNQGRVPGRGWYEHIHLGTNQRMTAWQAAVLSAQLERLPGQLERRAQNAAYLNQRLSKLDFLEIRPPDERVTIHSYCLYTIRLRPEAMDGVDVAAFTKALAAEGIPGAGYYPHPLHHNELFRKYAFRATECPRALAACRDMFWISHEVMLAGRDDLEDFIAALEKVASGVKELAGA